MVSKIEKCKRIIKEDGWWALIKRVFVYLYNKISFSRTYYRLYEKSLNGTKEGGLTPKISDFTLRIIRTSSEVEKLTAEGFNFSSNQSIQSIKELLNKGTILFCVFVGKEWAHMSWLAIDDSTIIDPFFKKAPRHNAGHIGPCVTNSKYRGLGLYPYVLSQICGFSKKNGRSKAAISTAKENLASHRGITKSGFSVCSEGYHLKIGPWTWWKE